MVSQIVKIGHNLLKYDVFYDQYQKLVGGVQYRKRIIQDLQKLQKPSFLDLGCGTASICSILDKEINYYGVDNSTTYLKRAKQNFPQFSFTEADVGSNQWNNKIKITSPLIATGLGLLHHLNDEQAKNFLIGCRSVLDKDSILFTVDPIITDSSSKIAKWFAKNDRGQYVRGTNAMRFLFKDNGFEPTIKIKRNQFNIPLDTIEISAKLA